MQIDKNLKNRVLFGHMCAQIERIGASLKEEPVCSFFSANSGELTVCFCE